MEQLERFKDFRTENGSSQGQNLALTGLLVPSSLDSGIPGAARLFRAWGGRATRLSLSLFGYPRRAGAPPGDVAVYLFSPIRCARALFRAKVDGFVPHTQHVNLRIVRTPTRVRQGNHTSSQSGIKSSCSIALMRTTRHRMPASASTHQGPKKRGFDPALRAGGEVDIPVAGWLCRACGWIRGGLVFKARRLLYHSTLGLRGIQKKKLSGTPVAGWPCRALSCRARRRTRGRLSPQSRIKSPSQSP